MSDTPDAPEVEPEEAPEAPEVEPTDEPETDAFDADRAREKIRKANSEAVALRKRAKEAEEKATANADAGEKVTALEAEILRMRVALKHGLPESLAERLKGTTEEELLADAEKLLDLLGGKKPPTQQPKERLRGGGDPTRDADPTANVDKFAEEAFRR